MLGNKNFYFESLRKYVTVFGTLFNDIIITHTKDNEVTAIMKVPLTYAPKNKLLIRADSDPDASKETAIDLPRMAFEIIPPLSYDGSRKLPNLEKYVRIIEGTPNKLKRQYVPVPYNINFSLYIYVKNVEDGNKIVEQILPFFTPDWTVGVNLIEDMNLQFDIPISLVNVSFEDKYDASFTDRRVLVWTLEFVMKSYFLGPIKEKPIIKFAYERFMFSPISENITDSVASSDVLAEILVSPGQDANGVATSNSSLTVNANVIYANSDFGFIESFTNGPITFE